MAVWTPVVVDCAVAGLAQWLLLLRIVRSSQNRSFLKVSASKKGLTTNSSVSHLVFFPFVPAWLSSCLDEFLRWSVLSSRLKGVVVVL